MRHGPCLLYWWFWFEKIKFYFIKNHLIKILKNATFSLFQGCISRKTQKLSPKIKMAKSRDFLSFLDSQTETKPARGIMISASNTNSKAKQMRSALFSSTSKSRKLKRVESVSEDIPDFTWPLSFNLFIQSVSRFHYPYKSFSFSRNSRVSATNKLSSHSLKKIIIIS